MRHLRLTLLFLLFACGPTDPSDVWQADLDEARSRWSTAGLADYSFHYTRSCFCPPFVVEVEVRDGRVISVRDIAADSLFSVPLPDLSIPHLFVELQEFIDRRPHELTATYDSVTGAPLQFSVDPIEHAVDVGYGVTTSAFRPLP